MTEIDDTACHTKRMGGVLAAATQNASRGGELAIAASQVVAKRVVLGLTAAVNPSRADHAEFARMVPEKVHAFSAAGAIMLKHSNQAGRQLTRFASDEVTATARATMAMAECRSVAALAQAQGTFARAWFDRVAANFIAMGMLALSAQDAVMAPIRQTVAVNAERLGR